MQRRPAAKWTKQTMAHMGGGLSCAPDKGSETLCDKRACIQESRKARLRGAVTFSDSWNCCTNSSMLKCSCAVTMSCSIAGQCVCRQLASTNDGSTTSVPQV